MLDPIKNEERETFGEKPDAFRGKRGYGDEQGGKLAHLISPLSQIRECFRYEH